MSSPDPPTETIPAAAADNVVESRELAEEEREERRIIGMLDAYTKEPGALNTLVGKLGAAVRSPDLRLSEGDRQSLEKNATNFLSRLNDSKEPEAKKKEVAAFRKFVEGLYQHDMQAKASAEEPIHHEASEVTIDTKVDDSPAPPAVPAKSRTRAPLIASPTAVPASC